MLWLKKAMRGRGLGHSGFTDFEACARLSGQVRGQSQIVIASAILPITQQS
jgi:hypothetical protein